MRKSIILTIIFCSTLILLPIVAKAQEYKQERLKPESIYSINSNNAPAQSESLNLSFNEAEGKIERVYFKVDLSTIPQNAEITESKLNFEISSCTGVTASITLARVVTNWDENIKWENRPGFSSPTITAELDCINQLGSWDISTIVKEWKAGKYENFGLIIYGPDESGTPPYSRLFNLNSENTYITVDYTQTSSISTDVPQDTSEKKPMSIYILILAAAAVVLPILVIGIILKIKYDTSIVNIILARFTIPRFLAKKKSTKQKESKELRQEVEDVKIEEELETAELIDSKNGLSENTKPDITRLTQKTKNGDNQEN